jgi:drug/metabolite transporter (DMT)-like permease
MSAAGSPPPPSAGLKSLAILVLLDSGLIVSWSAGFVGMRFALDYAPVWLVLFWRTLVAGLLLLPFALTIGPRLRLQHVLPHMLFGAMTMCAYLALFSIGIAQGVPTGLVALISDLLPMVVALLSWPLLGHALSGRQWLGSVIGMSGVLIASAHSLATGSAPHWAYALPVLGTLCVAVATLLQKRSSANVLPIHQSLCVQTLTAATLFGIYALREGRVIPPLERGFFEGISWLVIVATFGAYGLYIIALRRSSPARVTSVLYLSPPVTLIWARVMFGEPLTWPTAAGILVSLLGIIVFAKATPA